MLQNRYYPYVLTSEELESNNTSHIYLLNQTLRHCIDDFVEATESINKTLNNWEIKKGDLISKMAATLEKLHFANEYRDPLNTIANHIVKSLRARGISENQLDYVYQVLPDRYKRDYNRKGESENSHNQQNKTSEVEEQPPIPTVNIYSLIKKLEKLSPTELQNYALQTEQTQKHIRTNLKATKDAIEYVSIKTKTPLPKYKKVSAETPPEHLQGPTSMYHKLKEMSLTVFDIYKYLEDVAKSVYEFPPNEQLSKECTARLDAFDKGVLQTIKMMIVPYTDKKFSGDWPTWCNINLTRLEQSKNYAGSKHALETGEYAVKIGKDGKEVILSLDRGITREQVGDREPDLYIMARQTLLGNDMIHALHEWSYKTNIMEEYDEQGNPIVNNNNN